jgi:hypothetical protein
LWAIYHPDGTDKSTHDAMDLSSAPVRRDVKLPFEK